MKLKKKGKFPSMILGTLAVNLLGNLLMGKGVFQDSEETIRADQDF